MLTEQISKRNQSRMKSGKRKKKVVPKKTPMPEQRPEVRRTNFLEVPSRRIWSFSSATENSPPPAMKVPTNTTFFAFWLMLIKPPAPASRGPNRETLRLPMRSACASPRKAMSRPPPS